MKTKNLIIATVFFLGSLFIQSCQKDEIGDNTSENSILPTRFKIDLPSSMSNEQANLKSASTLKSASADTLKGNEIYQNLNTFVAVGEGAADIVQNIIGGIVLYKINRPMAFPYESKDDNRIKNVVVEENAEYNGKTWKYMLSITDAASETNTDGGKAMQIFWNPTPIEGIAILKPYNIDRTKDINAPDAIFRIEYSEVATSSYDSYMVVDIANLPMPEANLEPYAIKNMKMFVGKKGDNIDVYGNSDHPNAKFFTENTGFDWAFVASGSISKNISAAEVGLPPCKLDNNTRKVLLEDYSIKNVLTAQINEWFLQYFGIRPNSEDLASYLKNADAPGFFTKDGFLQAGKTPNDNYTPFVSRISNLTPYNPKLINELSVNFK